MRIQVTGQGSEETDEKLQAVIDKVVGVFKDRGVKCTIIQKQMTDKRIICTIASDLDAKVVANYLTKIGGKVKDDEIYGITIRIDGVEVGLAQHPKGAKAI